METTITKQAYSDIKESLQEYWFTVGEKQIIAAALLHALVLLVCHAFHLEESGLNTDIQILSVTVWSGFSAYLADMWLKEKTAKGGEFESIIETLVSLKQVMQWFSVVLFVSEIVIVMARGNMLLF